MCHKYDGADHLSDGNPDSLVFIHITWMILWDFLKCQWCANYPHYVIWYWLYCNKICNMNCIRQNVQQTYISSNI